MPIMLEAGGAWAAVQRCHSLMWQQHGPGFTFIARYAGACLTVTVWVSSLGYAALILLLPMMLVQHYIT